MQVRFAQVTLRPPHGKTELGQLTLGAVLAQEVEEPRGVKPLRWMLLTTSPVDSFQAACEKLRWYTLRWGIEVYHRTLKSGCKIEQRQLGTAERPEACLAIDWVVGLHVRLRVPGAQRKIWVRTSPSGSGEGYPNLFLFPDSFSPPPLGERGGGWGGQRIVKSQD
jgi:hypothetical protein